MESTKDEKVQFVYYSLRDILESLMRDYPEKIWFKYIDILNKYVTAPFKIVSECDNTGLHLEAYLNDNNIIKEHEYDAPIVTCAYQVTMSKEKGISTLRVGFAYRSVNDSADRLYGKHIALNRFKNIDKSTFSESPFQFLRSGSSITISNLVDDLTIQKDQFLISQMFIKTAEMYTTKKIKLTFALPNDYSNKTYSNVYSAIMDDLKVVLNEYRLSTFLYRIFDMITKRLVATESKPEACATIKIEKKPRKEKLSSDDVVKVFTCEGRNRFSYTVLKSKSGFDVFNTPFYVRMREKFGHMTRDQLLEYFKIPYPCDRGKELLSREKFMQLYEDQNKSLNLLIRAMRNDIKNEMKK